MNAPLDQTLAPLSDHTPQHAGPRLHSLSIRNFQSLHAVDLTLAPFTVIVGPSSSGKSALTRAIRTLVSNRRGTDWITHGERTASITAVTDHGTVTLTRSRVTGSSDNAYLLTSESAAAGASPAAPEEDSENERSAESAQSRTYSKLGGDTPEDVSRFLGIASTNPINFAGQFDKPFLLDDPSSEVARALGALTNVDVIFAGARESNRRKLNASALLRTRSEDLQAVKDRIPGIKALRTQDDALTRAEALIEDARAVQHRLRALSDALETIDVTVPLIDRLTPVATLVVPDDSGILEAQQALSDLRAALARVPAHSKAVQDAQQAYDAVEAQEATLLDRYQALAGSITQDLRGYFEAYIPASARLQQAGQDYVEVQQAVDVFVKFLETKAGC